MDIAQLQSHIDSEKCLNVIQRLAQLCRGQHIVLDAKLDQLNSPIFLQATESEQQCMLENINALLLEHRDTIEQSMHQAKMSLFESAQTLKRSVPLSASERDRVQRLMQRCQQPQASVLNLLPLIDELVQLYQVGYQVNAGLRNDKPEAVSSKSLEQHQTKLITLLNSLQSQDVLKHELQPYCTQLTTPLSATALITCCSDMLRIVLGALERHRNQSQQFLQKLAGNLLQLNRRMKLAIRENRGIQQEARKLHLDLTAQLQQLQQDVTDQPLQEVQSEVLLQLQGMMGQIELLQQNQEQQERVSNDLHHMQQRMQQLEAQSQAYQEQLSKQQNKMYTDALTNLPNRAAFDERLELEFSRWSVKGEPLSMAILDLDHFKAVNDNFGHSAGDKTLQVIGSMLCKWLRGSDFFARYGGEEFVILMPGQSLDNILPVLARLCLQISELPFKFKNKPVQVTASIGAAQFNPGDTTASVFDRADHLLYQAKQQGRNRVCLAEAKIKE